MISNHLGMVEALRPASNELAAAVEQFLAAGGQIDVAKPPPPPKPVVYVPQEPPAPKPFVRRRTETIPLADPTPAELREEKRMKRVELVMQLAKTHTQKEVIVATGIARRTLLGMSKEFGFSFKRGHPEPTYTNDPALVEQIKACKEQGLSRRQACEKLRIIHTTLARIVDRYEIDYPKSKAGGSRCAA